jgi:hypothetical protein
MRNSFSTLRHLPRMGYTRHRFRPSKADGRSNEDLTVFESPFRDPRQYSYSISMHNSSYSDSLGIRKTNHLSIDWQHFSHPSNHFSCHRFCNHFYTFQHVFLRTRKHTHSSTHGPSSHEHLSTIIVIVIAFFSSFTHLEGVLFVSFFFFSLTEEVFLCFAF